MEDGLDPLACEQLAERLGIGVRADVQAGACRDRGAMPGRQVVEHDHVMAGGQERVDRDGADVAGPAGHQDPRHGANLTWSGGAGPTSSNGTGDRPERERGEP